MKVEGLPDLPPPPKLEELQLTLSLEEAIDLMVLFGLLWVGRDDRLRLSESLTEENYKMHLLGRFGLPGDGFKAGSQVKETTDQIFSLVEGILLSRKKGG